ncbi:MAG: LytTR family transcriptional regulator DNA-binding domain-containing protein [Acetatifactor sp.]|nr:LytTR family transcriptional regulator DNA-binding domain-containing protein [Acetatifactor sp.]
MNELLVVETYGRNLRYLMLDGKEHFCEGLISETARSLSQFGFFQIHRSYKVIIGRAHNKEFKKEFFKWRMWFDN